MLSRPFTVGPLNSATMQTAVIDGNYFPWQWRLFPFPSRSLAVPIPTIDSMFLPFPWHFHGIPIPNPLGQYQIILLGDRGTCVSVTCLGTLRGGAQLGLEPVPYDHKSNALPVSARRRHPIG